MSGKFPNLSRWLCKGKKRDAKSQSNNNPILNSSSNSNGLESDLLRYPGVGGGKPRFTSKRGKTKGRGRELGKIDREHDSIVVPSDGYESSSDSESVGSDWSIGWSEPHAPGFLSDDEIDSGFGVLVRCYGRGQTNGGKPDKNKNSIGSISHEPNLYVADSQKHMERWLSSLQGGS